MEAPPPVAEPSASAASHTATNYDKWDKLDLSDDEDVSDCHPNIDGKLWLRLKKEKQHRKWQEEDEQARQWDAEQAGRVTKMAELQEEIQRRTDAGFSDGLAPLREQVATLAGEMEGARKKKDKYLERKKWRSSEVAEVDQSSEVKTSERLALERQEEVAKMSRDARMSKAADGKEAGTALFKQQQWAAARDAYADAFDYVRMFDFPEDMVAARDLRLSLALNLAAVSLKLEEWGKAAAYASKALDVDPDNLKAIYRRGQARIGTRDYEDAKKDLLRAAKMSPKDKNIRRHYEQAKQLHAKSLKPKTDDEKADEYVEAAQKHEQVYRHFAYLRRDSESEEYINAHPELLTEHATGWMLLHCLELEMAGNHREMVRVARQNEMLEYITRSCKELKVVDDPRAATMPFFRSMRADDPRAREGFDADTKGVIDKITARAKQKKIEMESQQPEEGEIHVEKIEIEGQEFLVEKKQGLVYLDNGEGKLVHVGNWEDTEVEGEGRVHMLPPEQRDSSKDLQLA